MSFDLFAYRELKDTAADCEDRYDHLERMMRFPDPAVDERFHWKQSGGVCRGGGRFPRGGRGQPDGVQRYRVPGDEACLRKN